LSYTILASLSINKSYKCLIINESYDFYEFIPRSPATSFNLSIDNAYNMSISICFVSEGIPQSKFSIVASGWGEYFIMGTPSFWLNSIEM
jgi:hypothetical protein